MMQPMDCELKKKKEKRCPSSMAKKIASLVQVCELSFVPVVVIFVFVLTFSTFFTICYRDRMY